MNRLISKLAVVAFTLLALALGSGSAQAQLTYSGYQPWWNIFARRPRCMTCEEERLQKFWHDYYHAMSRYYRALDRIDWVAYYKNHGYQINAGCGAPGYGPGCCQRINYAPVFVSPTMQWAVPNACLSGPPGGPGGCCPPPGPGY